MAKSIRILTRLFVGRIRPNLQNIPIRDEYGRYIRKAFVTSDENHTFEIIHWN